MNLSFKAAYGDFSHSASKTPVLRVMLSSFAIAVCGKVPTKPFP